MMYYSTLFKLSFASWILLRKNLEHDPALMGEHFPRVLREWEEKQISWAFWKSSMLVHCASSGTGSMASKELLSFSAFPWTLSWLVLHMSNRGFHVCFIQDMSQEGYGTRSQPPITQGKPNHEELNLIQQERPSSLPVSCNDVFCVENNTVNSTVQARFWNFAYLMFFCISEVDFKMKKKNGSKFADQEKLFFLI